MAYTATVALNGLMHTAHVDTATDAPDDDREGAVTGSPSLLAALREHAGRPVSASPVGPAVEALDTNDPEQVMVALMALGRVVSVTGDVPNVWADEEEDPATVGAVH